MRGCQSGSYLDLALLYPLRKVGRLVGSNEVRKEEEAGNCTEEMKYMGMDIFCRCRKSEPVE